ncbi:MAG: sulfatase [Gammaproteobacteria bacterium]|nr:sulfatase [Gammaproteobacteria bacterium]MCY4276802.1 sulfatase [Gammaproteobacteria bacterium]MCY4322097.1 sulfatase [Gammaproteobacteria bacterium]
MRDLWLLLVLFIWPLHAAAERPPNLVFIVADDLAWNQVGYHGSDFYETPNIDAIARAGMQFSNAYSANPVCSPTRASLMTGKNPARLGITDYIPGSPYPYARLRRPSAVPGLPLEEVTIADMMRALGFATGHFGKWHLNIDKHYAPGRPGDPASQGFDDVLTTVKPEYEADPSADAHNALAITERSLAFIDANNDRPFFLYVPHHTVHRPLLENPELIAKYQAKPNADCPINNPVMGAMIETMDIGIGRILDRLQAHALSERTIVIFYSDNGGFEQLQSQAPFRGGKAMLWEGGLRVPLAVKWPGVVEAGTSSDALVTSDDFFPTIADIFGVDSLPADIDGLSLLPLLNGARHLDRTTLFFHYPHYHHLGYAPAGAMRTGDYKLIEWFEGAIAGVGQAASLFDLRRDPGETHDIAGANPELVLQMRARLAAWRQEVGASEMTINPDFDPERADWRFSHEHGGDSR